MRQFDAIHVHRLMVTVVLCGSFTIGASAQVGLSLGSGSGSRGNAVNLNLTLNATGSTQPAALQWTLGYNATDISSITVVTGSAATNAGKSVTCNPVGGVLNCIVFGLNTTTIANGVVATVLATISPSTSSVATALPLTGGVAADPNGNGIAPVTTTGGTITINQPVTLVPVTVTTNPTGLSIIADGLTFTSPQVFQWTPGTSHSVSVVSPQGSGTRLNFLSWSDGGAFTHNITAPSAAATVTANFQTSYLLTTQSAPFGSGTIQVSPPSPDGYYTSGSLVQLISAAGTAYQFSSWAGDLSGSVSPSTVVMNAPKSVTASFAPASSCNYSLTQASFSAHSAGDVGRVDVQTTGQCVWSAVSNTSWITVDAGGAGTGNGTVRFTVAANPAMNVRMGSITIGGQTFTVGQSGAGCGIGLSVTAPAAAQSNGGALSLNIAAPAGCEWYSAAGSSWLTLNSASTGSGSSNAQLSTTANNSASPRTSAVSVGGLVSRLIQTTSAQTQTFTDVPLNHAFADHVSLLRLYGVTNGCTATEFCPDAPTTRWQMAIFLVRTIVGTDNFAFPSNPYFTDVPSTHPWFKYIQKLRELNVTTGCTATQYCPNDLVTRSQMAAFLIRAKLALQSGQTFPYPTSPYFQDVPSSQFYFPFIQKLRQLGVTIGCSAVEYCPDSPTTRGQMAAFLIRAFFTPY